MDGRSGGDDERSGSSGGGGGFGGGVCYKVVVELIFVGMKLCQ